MSEYISLVISICSAVIAATAIYISLKKQASQSLLEQAQLSLERAYNTLTNDGKNISPPLPNNLNWLTTARYIERYKDLKSRITDKTHRLICDQQEEYWRHRFHLVLDHESFNQQNYYTGGFPKGFTKSIEPRAVIVIHAFSKWNKQQIDPIHAVNIDDYISDGKIFNGRPGLKCYIQQYEELRRRRINHSN